MPEAVDRSPAGATVPVVVGAPDAEARLARAAGRLPGALRRLLQRVAGELTRRALVQTPVRTGRARAAWAGSLEQLGETPPTGWQGAGPDAEAVAQGRQSGRVQSQLDGHRQAIDVTNAVPYIVVLELGGRGRAGKHMVRRSMLETREKVRSLFRDLVAELFE